LWNGGEVAAAARVRGDCAVEALLRIEFLVLLVQAKRTKKKIDENGNHESIQLARACRT
jgi:hypothetical protein